jgi:hypothetical protein
MLRTWMGIGLFVGTAVVVISVAACGTDAVGIETCRQIESARCQQAPNCPVATVDGGIDLSLPVHRNSPTTDVEACIRYYHDACLHGLAVPDPGAVATNACIAAINTGNCQYVAHPETAPACAWLYPAPPPVVDAAADALDSATDAADGAD